MGTVRRGGGAPCEGPVRGAKVRCGVRRSGAKRRRPVRTGDGSITRDAPRDARPEWTAQGKLPEPNAQSREPGAESPEPRAETRERVMTDHPWIGAVEAARLLGVSRTTLYAYVSRGYVRS